MIKLLREYKKIAKKITKSDIQAGCDDEEITLESLLNFGRIQSKSKLFLGIFSNAGLKYMLNQFHLIEELENLGLTNITSEIETSDSHTHKLYIYSGEPNPSNVICELVAKKGPLHFEKGLLKNYPKVQMNFLQIEWLLLQNPKKRFADDRPRLPGQSYPGLGLGKNLMVLIMILAQNAGLDGIINKPHFFHTAFMFTKKFVFVDPYKQAEIEMLSKDLLKKYSFYHLSWASFFECIVNEKTGSVFHWEPDFLIFPMTKRLLKYFDSKEYKKQVMMYKNDFKYRLDEDKYKQMIEEHNLVRKLE
ncbi:MAG: hypothetical protein JXQ65_02165 [Candidatus Marinimicrobia bacterium]|nr:hypothetical protein [Candidatus Neomarinimicrobiota bacterium]